MKTRDRWRLWSVVLGISILAGGEAALGARPEMDHGAFISYSVIQNVGRGYVDLAPRGITIRVGSEAYVCFDGDLMRMVGAWNGKDLDLSKANYSEMKGSLGGIAQAMWVSTKALPGWSSDGTFVDPRQDHLGPLAKEVAHYRGLYRCGEKTVLSYTVGKREVLELDEMSQGVLTRTMHVTAGEKLSAMLFHPSTATGRVEGNSFVAGEMGATIVDGPAGAVLEAIAGGDVVLRLPAMKESGSIRVALWNGKPPAKLPAMADVAALCKGGPSQWKAVTAAGVLGKDDSAYTVDLVTLPEPNPWNAGMRLSGFDFFSDGRAAVCTMAGDVWIVSGLDAKLEKLQWRRFAAGLYEALGLKIVNDQVFVLGRDQITRLHDLDGDGEADYYENFNNDHAVDSIYHAFALDLQADKEGNLYYARGGNQVKPGFRDHSVLAKVSKDGSKYEVFATGFRAPNGMGVGPDDQVVCSDNQGHWTPTNKISLIEQGKYYGYPGDPRKVSRDAQYSAADTRDYTKPLVWLPMHLDNSAGGQTWCTSDKWGPFSGQMIHTSYGKCAIFEVMTEKVDGVMQGAIAPFKLNFPSGVMRARFSPTDGQLYVCGLKGWQTSAGKDGVLARVRYTGKPVYMPREFHAIKDGLQLGFACELDEKSAGDAQSYEVEMWNYKWSAEYGSKDYSVLSAGKMGRDNLEVKSAKVEGKMVTLEVPELKPAMQVRVVYKIKAKDGTGMASEVDGTIHGMK